MIVVQESGSLDAPRTDGPEDSTTQRLDALEAQLGLLFNRFRQEVRARSFELDPSLAPAVYHTFRTLAHLGPTKQSVLGDTLCLDKSALSRHLHQLLELGLVVRKRDEVDHRAAIVTLSTDARTRLEQDRNSARDSFRARLATWSAEELDDLVRLLAKLSQESFAEQR